MSSRFASGPEMQGHIMRRKVTTTLSFMKIFNVYSENSQSFHLFAPDQTPRATLYIGGNAHEHHS